jgi:VanZ family protein
MIFLYLTALRIPRGFYLALASFLYLLMLYMGMIESSVQALPGRANLSKVYHLVFYAGLAGMLWFGARRPAILKVTALVMIAGAIDELHQYFLPFREARFSDVLIDTISALTAVVLLFLLRQRAVMSGRLHIVADGSTRAAAGRQE